jgi:predicted dehydrogenase
MSNHRRRRRQHQQSLSSRRDFLATSSAAVAAAATLGFNIVPRSALGGPRHTPPSGKLNLACVGCGGMGGAQIAEFARLKCNIVALCDVDEKRGEQTFADHPDARRYKDFREMLEKEADNIDAVTIGTPDHTHAVITMAAIDAGKHVYCQKPLTHTLHEARALTEAARAAGVVTQMGNQGHGTEGARLTNEWLAAGVIGDVREVHCWTDRPGSWWKQGVPRPTDCPKPPDTLDWNLWLGPVHERPYNPAYLPMSWRGWWDFGTGALGDMGCHIIDHPVWALKLTAPTHIEARATTAGTVLADGKLNFESYPIASIIHYDFPRRGDLPPVRLTWYEGGLMPATPETFAADQKLDGNGVLYVGTKGCMFHSSHGGMPDVAPVSLREAAKAVPKTMPRSPGHYEEWVAACKGSGKTMSNFDYAGPLTEIVLLGLLALRSPGKRLEWNSEHQQVTNAPELNQYVTSEYRKGWELV